MKEEAENNGRRGGTRTPDPRIRNPLLYPPELHAHGYLELDNIGGVALSQMNDSQWAGLDLERRFRKRGIAPWRLDHAINPNPLIALPPIASLCHLSLILSIMPGVLSHARCQEVRDLTSGIYQWRVHAFC